MKYELLQMRQQGGAIVNMASGYGVVGSPRGVGAYVASKHGVIGLTKVAALEHAKAGIRVNAVLPGWIHTPMTAPGLRNDPQHEARILEHTPVGRMGTSDEVAEAVVWLCSGAASVVTGHSMVIDGGLLSWAGT